MKLYNRYTSKEIGDFDISNGANLYGANLYEADLRGANLRGASLKNNGLLEIPEGEIIVYKNANNTILTLKLAVDSLRLCATTNKCRTNKAFVVSSSNGTTEILSDYDSSFIYKVGEWVYVNNFDLNRWNECSTGIHFFLTEEEALEY